MGLVPKGIKEKILPNTLKYASDNKIENLNSVISNIKDAGLEDFKLDNYNRIKVTIKDGHEPVKCFGIEYNSVIDISEAFGVSITKINKDHMSNGYTSKEDYGKTIDKIISEGFEFLGKIYTSRSLLYSEYGVYDTFVRGRMSRGMTLVEALTTPIKQKRPRNKCEINGKKYPSIVDACRENNISPDYIKKLHKQFNIPYEELLDSLVKYFSFFNIEDNIRCIPLVIYNGKAYFELEDFVKAIGLCRRDFENVRSKYKNKFSVCNGLLEIAEDLKNQKVSGKEYKGVWVPITEINRLGLGKLLRKSPIIEKLRYPDCTFERVSFCKNNFLDCKEMINNLSKKHNNGKLIVGFKI